MRPSARAHSIYLDFSGSAAPCASEHLYLRQVRSARADAGVVSAPDRNARASGERVLLTGSADGEPGRPVLRDNRERGSLDFCERKSNV